MNPERAANPDLHLVRKPSPFPEFFAPPTHTDQPVLKRMEHSYHRWDMTRRTNPFITEQCATGFEGYFIGLGHSPETVAELIAQLGAGVLHSFKLLHPHDPRYISRIWKVVKGEVYDHQLMAELNSCLQATAAKLRVQVLPQLNPRGDEFRATIAKKVEAEHIIFHAEAGVVTEHSIAVPTTNSQNGAIAVEATSFSSESLNQGYAFMQLLGKMGYPLVQLAINK